MSQSAPDLVPLRDRLWSMQGVRVAGVGLAVVYLLVLPEAAVGGTQRLVAVSTAYLAVCLSAGATWTVAAGSGPLARRLPGLLLLLDGLWLAGIVWATGGPTSPLATMVVVHLVAAALLASYRSGLKIALWESLLLLLGDDARRGGLFSAPAAVPGPGAQLTVFIVALWVVVVSTALASAVNERELRRRRRELEAFGLMARRLERDPVPAVVADVLADTLAATFGFHRVAVVRDGLLLASRGPVGSVPDPAPTTGVLARTSTASGPVLAGRLNPIADGWLAAVLPDARNLIFVPLLASGTAATVVLEQPAGSTRVARRVLASVESFTGHAGLVLAGAQLQQRLTELASTDGLTGLANRRRFDEGLAAEVARTQRSGVPMALLLLDVDHFKRVNDVHGHATGDEVLREVAALLRAGCRDFDLAARYGGEEFAAVLPGADVAAAVAVAERLRRQIAGAALAVPVTVSIGVAGCPEQTSDPAGLIAAADAALYTAKRSGRDRVVAAHADPAAALAA